MNVNRVDYNGGTLIDLTSDTVTAADLPAGVTAHDRSGTPITGTANYQPRTLDSSVTIGAETETTVEGAIGELADLVPSTAAPGTNKLATVGDVNGEEIAITASTSPVSTASGSLRKIAIFGKSEVVDGSIVSAGEGWSTVDLGTLTWSRSTSYTNAFYYTTITGIKGNGNGITARFTKIANKDAPDFGREANDNEYCFNIDQASEQIFIRCDEYADAVAFKTAMSGVLLCYQLADPTQGNAIAVKTDDTTGIDGTMAAFTTGTPLRGIPDTDVRDVMQWNGTSGEVTNVCGKVRLADLTWIKQGEYAEYRTPLVTNMKGYADNIIANALCTQYDIVTTIQAYHATVKGLAISNSYISISDTDYTTVSDLVASLGDAELVYELATPVTTPFTTAENNSFAALQTYSPQTAISITDSPEFEVETYAGSANGKAVATIDNKFKYKDDEINNRVTNISSMIAAPYDETATYAQGDYCTNSGALYKANVAIITPEPFTAAHWTATTVMAEIT